MHSGDPREAARGALTRACEHLARTQAADGAWRLPPAPRILENALACLVAEAFVPELLPHVAAARHWVREAAVQRHHEVPRVLDSWLQAWVGGRAREAGLDLTHAAFSEPVFAPRRLTFCALALALDAPVQGGLPRELLQARMLELVRTRHVSRLKTWSVAEAAALFLLLGGTGSPEDTALALDALCEAQLPSGSFGEHQVATFLSLAALRRQAPGSAPFARALDFLVRTRAEDGTWRFSHADVWDTALLCRALEGHEGFGATLRGAAEAFLLRHQNPDGGWPYRNDVESDTDTTGMVMLSLSPGAASLAASREGAGYLSRMRTEAGLWRTWHYREDPPAEEVVAHAVLGLRKWGAARDAWSPGAQWLATRLHEDTGWRAHWYNIQSYAAHEIGMALGPSHAATRHAARLLVARRNADGGWGPTAGAASSAAATGMSLALLGHYLPAEHPLVSRAVHLLVDLQEPSGAWPGPVEMFVPRPFAIDYPMQGLALAAHGLAVVARPPRAPLIPLD